MVSYALLLLSISCSGQKYKNYLSSPFEVTPPSPVVVTPPSLVGGSVGGMVVEIGVTVSCAVLCTISIGGSLTSTFAGSSDDKVLVRFWITLQVTVKEVVARVMTNVLVSDPSLLVLVLDMPQFESSEQFHTISRSPGPVAVQLKVAFSY
jgi:hypothetical protein